MYRFSTVVIMQCNYAAENLAENDRDTILGPQILSPFRGIPGTIGDCGAPRSPPPTGPNPATFDHG